MQSKNTLAFQQKLGEVRYYLDAIESVHKKLSAQSEFLLHQQQPEGFTFAQAYLDRFNLAPIIANAMTSGEYRFLPARIVSLILEGKQRQLYAFGVFDRVAHSALYRMLSEDINPLLPPQIYSYIKGRGKHIAIRNFAAYVREHVKARHRPQDRGIYVLRCDIRAYADSIPVHMNSRLWLQLETAFAQTYGRPPTPREHELLVQLIRPTLTDELNEGTYSKLYGVPTGAPISSLLFNLYAAPLDHALNIRGGFYARYGDDMLFAHPDADIFEQSVVRFYAAMEILELQANEKKTMKCFFNGAGKSEGSFKGANYIEFLGLQIAFDGTAMLKNEKLRELYSNITIRAKATAAATAHYTPDERGRALCEMLNSVFDAEHGMAHPIARLMTGVINDRKQLRQIDYWLARLVLQYALGEEGVKAFRSVPYRKIREEWHLRSLEYARNY